MSDVLEKEERQENLPAAEPPAEAPAQTPEAPAGKGPSPLQKWRDMPRKKRRRLIRRVILLAVLVVSTTYYTMWVLGIALFAFAVYYTTKLM